LFQFSINISSHLIRAGKLFLSKVTPLEASFWFIEDSIISCFFHFSAIILSINHVLASDWFSGEISVLDIQIIFVSHGAVIIYQRQPSGIHCFHDL
jgi:hypothetical protein